MSQKQSSSLHWDGSKMPPQVGKIAIVTGANWGIGYFTARALAERGAYVVLACRSESRGHVAEQEMTAYLSELKQKQNKDQVIGSVELMQVDLSNLASERAFAEELRRRPAATHVDLLINNAGVVFPPQPLTADGLETHFGVNHVSHFLLTTLLFDLLKAAPAARVVSISSLAHRRAASLEFDSLVKGTGHPFDLFKRKHNGAGGCTCSTASRSTCRLRPLASKPTKHTPRGRPTVARPYSSASKSPPHTANVSPVNSSLSVHSRVASSLFWLCTPGSSFTGHPRRPSSGP